MGSIPVGGARMSTVIVCELVSVDCKDGVPRIHTRAIVKRGSFPSAIPKYALYQKVLFLLYRKVGIPLRETHSRWKNCLDGNLHPTLILFPKIVFFEKMYY